MSLIPWLDQSLEFPATTQALDEPNGLLAAGGDLEPARLLAAYQRGIFPWYEEDQVIMWWSPSPRMVLFPESLHISRSLHKTLKKQPFTLSMDQDFPAVIEACAQQRAYASGTWITEEMQDAYCLLHQLGHAHSVECWQNQQLVGGLYGVAIGKVFFGESMFSLRDNASKAALVHLCGQLKCWGFKLIDCQQHTEHLASMGAEEISREAFERQLNQSSSQINSQALDHTGQGKHWQLLWSYQQAEN